MGMEPGQVIGFIIGTIVILFAAYYVTYFIGTKASGQRLGALRNRNISLHDRYAISRTASFCVVEIAGKVYIVGVTGNAMTLLDTLDAADFLELTKENAAAPMPWGATPVGKYGNKLTKSLVAFIAAKTGRTLPQTSDVSELSSSENDFSQSLREAEMKNETEQPETQPEEPEED